MKKILLVIILSFINPMFAQNEEVKTTVKTEKFDGKSSISTEFVSNFGKDQSGSSLSLNLSKSNDNEITYLSIIYSGKIGCLVQNSSKLSIKLTNDTIIEFLQISKTDCANVVSASFVPLKESELNLPANIATEIIKNNIEQLKKFPWVVIRLFGSEHYTDIEPYPTRRNKIPEQLFIKHLEAIDNNKEFISIKK